MSPQSDDSDARALEQRIEHLEQAHSQLVQLVNILANDLRSPLQLICTYANMVPDAGPVTEQQQEFLTGINRAVAKMSGLIDDLLDLAKIEAGVDMEQEVCQLDEIVAQVLWRFASVAGLR